MKPAITKRCIQNGDRKVKKDVDIPAGRSIEMRNHQLIQLCKWNLPAV